MHRITLVALVLAALPQAAFACDMGEKLRLSEEQKKLAARNAWTGVERAYESLHTTKCALEYNNQFLGAESARMLGKVYEQYERLTASLEVAPDTDETGSDPRPRIQASIEAIERSYTRVEIRGDPRRRPVLTRPEMPFAPDQRKAVEWGQTFLVETGSFKGMLPMGKYVVGDVEFTLEASADWTIVEVGKQKKASGTAVAAGPEGESVGGTQTQSFFRYTHLVATAGPSLFSSPQTAKPHVLNDGGHAFDPSNVALSGFNVQVGVESGLTYSEPALGAALLLGYQGGFGTDSFNTVSLWGAGIARPGNARLAFGPMYQGTFGAGSGVATWFDRGHEKPNEQILYGGYSFGGGLQASAGYGLIDLDKLQGIVELGASWQSDARRNFFGIGVRVGLVPTVPRFKG